MFLFLSFRNLIIKQRIDKLLWFKWVNTNAKFFRWSSKYEPNTLKNKQGQLMLPL